MSVHSRHEYASGSSLHVPPSRAFARTVRQFLVLDIEKLVDSDHVVRAIWEVTGSVDLSAFYEPIAALDSLCIEVLGILRAEDLLTRERLERLELAVSELRELQQAAGYGREARGDWPK